VAAIELVDEETQSLVRRLFLHKQAQMRQQIVVDGLDPRERLLGQLLEFHQIVSLRQTEQVSQVPGVPDRGRSRRPLGAQFL
jgi:hypothetical protein